MRRYILQRLLLTVPTLLGATLIAFALVVAAPGDPAQLLAGRDSVPADVEAIRDQMGLNKPFHVQYVRFLSRLMRGDLGRSMRLPTSVGEEIRVRFPATLELAALAILLATGVGVVLGIVSAVRRYSWVDDWAMIIAVAGISIPSFWLGLLFILLFSLYLGWVPPSGRAGGITTLDGVRSLALPVMTLAVAPIAYVTRLTRSAMLEIIAQDFMRTARAKGASERRVILNHGLRNAALSVLTFVGMEFGYLLGGIVVVETVFSWPGLGRATAMAVFARDYPLIQGAVLTLAVVFVLINLAVDLLYASLDPRIRYG